MREENKQTTKQLKQLKTQNKNKQAKGQWDKQKYPNKAKRDKKLAKTPGSSLCVDQLLGYGACSQVCLRYHGRKLILSFASRCRQLLG